MKNLAALFLFTIAIQCHSQSLPNKWHKVDTINGKAFELNLRSSDIQLQDSLIFVAFKEIVGNKKVNYYAVVYVPMDSRYIESDCIDGKSYGDAIKIAKAKVKEPRFIDTWTGEVRDKSLLEGFILPHAKKKGRKP